MLKMAISGAGYAASYFVKALTELGIPVAGIANRTQEKGRQLAEEAGAPFYETLEELLESSDPDIVIIATATEIHAKDIKTAAEKGIRRIFCEKPVGVDITETRNIARLCDQHKTFLGVGYKMRYEPIFKQAKEWVESGRIGNLSTIAISFYQPIPHSPWYLDSGFIRETLVHPIDLSNWFAGAVPAGVTCIAENHAGGSKEDRVSTVIGYDSGITAQVNGGWIRNYPYIPGRQNICFQLVGTGGYLCGVRPNRLIVCDEKGSQCIDIAADDPIKLELQDFIEKSAQGANPPIGIVDALRVQAIVAGAQRSADLGSTVALQKG